jgi:uncharacterized protein YbjT (DUF2867 family)
VRIFIAGASGVTGTRLVPLLIKEGRTVAGTTRSPDKASMLRALGAEPVARDVFDAAALTEAMVSGRGDTPRGCLGCARDGRGVGSSVAV